MKFLVLFLSLPLLVLALTSSEEKFFNAHAINTNCQGNTTFGSFSSCTITCFSLHHLPDQCNPLYQLGCKCKTGFIPLNQNFQNLRCVKRKDCSRFVPQHKRSS
ncbi:hypothetical protein NPIL_345572 [Nephila pilipes]|uniref:Spider venom protein n=1 Tax=Nephila pilipes TaxID=299642 RepID=A0A8X6NUU4_NEPPI|nr:hypothetical protein NPIL_345572 [Nephila pilipes]